jgi:hypothetical protein
LDQRSDLKTKRTLGAWQAIVPPPNITSAFKQTGLHPSWNAEHPCGVGELRDNAKFMSERTVGASQRQQR